MHILIVEDNLVASMELEELLEAEGYKVAGVAHSGSEAVSKAVELEPDLILMDIKLSDGIDGIAAAERIKSYTQVPIVFLTGYSEPEIVQRACKLHPEGFVLKPYNGAQIRAAIEIALSNHNSLKNNRNYDVSTGIAFSEPVFSKMLHKAFPSLTNSEKRIAYLVLKGLHTKEISRQLGLSRHTVSWHRGNIRKKIGIDNRSKGLMAAFQELPM